jgi:hypothetical protein
VIKRQGAKYWIRSKANKHLGGPYDTLEEAKTREEQIKKHAKLSRQVKKLKDKYGK